MKKMLLKMKSLNIEVWKIYINECKRISAYYTY